MYHFDSDYMEGAHPKVLQRLIETNMVQTPGYGTDYYCKSAKEKIRKACSSPNAEVHFLVGGTQTNTTVIKAILRPFQGVIAPDTGHINVFEAGTVEAGGHKILTLPNQDGKISAAQVLDYMNIFNRDGDHNHMVHPGMVYISHPTEQGTLYSKDELEKLSDVCKENNLPLFLDGARLGYGLTAKGSDVSIETIAKNCDVFYIGGTKVGALFGEAVVITNDDLIDNLPTIIKQQGGLLAKGRLLGVQFDTLFTDNLYLDVAKRGTEMAEKLKNGFAEKGYEFYSESPTNQQFIILANKKKEELAKEVTFGFWRRVDEDHTAVRFVTSWGTRDEDIEQLIELL
ncbi:MAG: low specificity L-threonine aldolase [Micrococcaceae bacterium]